MIDNKLEKALKQSGLIPAKYIASDNIFQYKNMALKANGSVVMLLGAADDGDTVEEAEMLIKNNTLKGYVSAALEIPVEDINLSYCSIDAKSVLTKDGEYIGICSKERGAIEYGEEDGELIWIIVCKNNALTLATALSISSDIEAIAYKARGGEQC